MIKRKQIYKALMIDVDGTLMPNKRNSFPSAKVIASITKASKKIHVGLATSRPIFMLHHILDKLSLTGPSIINSGSEIIDVNTKKILWQQPLLNEDVKKVTDYIIKNNLPAFVNSTDKDYVLSEAYKNDITLQIYVSTISDQMAEKIISDLSHISTISIHKVPSFTKDEISVLITHASATKQHGILTVADILGIKTRDIIGIGDGYNDFPLLMACGLKIAIGNAVADLKAIADYVAPTVDEDGVADVINRFVL